MNRGLLIFTFLLSPFLVCARTGIKGSVSNEEKKPLPYANIILMHSSDSAVVKAALSDEQGRYKFEDLEPGNYLVMISQLGYQKHFAPAEVVANSADVELGAVEISPLAINLQEATVSAMKPFIEHRIDRTVVNVENSIVNAGGTALEVLRRSPGVTIDSDGNIILTGKQGVLVTIDDKPTYLSQRDLYEWLRNTSSEQLSSIEIITNPSAKYDAAGTSGIINLKMRKRQLMGLNGRMMVSYGQGVYPDFGTGFNLNYGGERLNFFAGYDYMDGLYFETIDMTRRFTKDGGQSLFSQHTFDKGHYRNHTFRGGADWNLTKQQSIGVLLKGNRYANIDNTTAGTDIYNQSATADSGYVTYNHSDSKWSNISGNINYRYEIDTTGKVLTLDADLAHFDNHNNFNFETDHYNAGSDFLYREIATSTQPALIDIRSFKGDYTHPFSKTMKLEAGAKTSHVETDNDVTYFDYYGGIAVADTGKTNHFIYKEDIHAAYVNWSAEFGKVGIQTGLRAEQTVSEGNQLSDGTTFRREYFRLFPSTFLSYTFNDKHRLKASYSRRIDRPAYQQLNPFKYFVDPYNYMEGNPSLQPQLTNSFELGYTFKQLFTIALQYRHTMDAMTQITKQIDSTHTTFVTTENLDSYDNYGINLSVPIKVTEWFQSSNDINVFRNRYKGESSAGFFDKHLTSYTINSSNSLSLPKGISAEINFWYNSKMVWGTWLVDPHFGLSAGVSRSFMEDKIHVRINFNDIFHSEKINSQIKYQNIDATFKRVYDSQFFRVHVSYKFGKQKRRMQFRGSASQEEQDRVRQGR